MTEQENNVCVYECECADTKQNGSLKYLLYRQLLCNKQVIMCWNEWYPIDSMCENLSHLHNCEFILL